MGAVEPSVWKPTAAAATVWAVRDQWVASSLLQHVQPDMEPAGIWSGVSFSQFILTTSH